MVGTTTVAPSFKLTGRASRSHWPASPVIGQWSRRVGHREEQPQRRRNWTPPGPVPTLGELQAGSGKWMWAICNGTDTSGRIPCQHRAPLALAPFVIRWGANAPSDVMRERLRCALCGHRDATLQRPSWMGNEIGEQPFPAEREREDSDD
jgi:hypothetical protein